MNKIKRIYLLNREALGTLKDQLPKDSDWYFEKEQVHKRTVAISIFNNKEYSSIALAVLGEHLKSKGLIKDYKIRTHDLNGIEFYPAHLTVVLEREKYPNLLEIQEVEVDPRPAPTYKRSPEVQEFVDLCKDLLGRPTYHEWSSFGRKSKKNRRRMKWEYVEPELGVMDRLRALAANAECRIRVDNFTVYASYPVQPIVENPT